MASIKVRPPKIKASRKIPRIPGPCWRLGRQKSGSSETVAPVYLQIRRITGITLTAPPGRMTVRLYDP
jgi:hypothetical protein